VLQQVRSSGRTDNGKISTLFYHRYIEDSLRGFDETDADGITADFVLAEIERAAQAMEKELAATEHRKDEEARATLERKEKEFLEQLREEVSKKEKEKDREWLEKITAIKRVQRRRAEKTGKRTAFAFCCGLTVVFLGGTSAAYFGLAAIKAQEFVAFLLSVLPGGGLITLLWSKCRKTLESRATEKAYRKRLAELGLGGPPDRAAS